MKISFFTEKEIKQEDYENLTTLFTSFLVDVEYKYEKEGKVILLHTGASGLERHIINEIERGNESGLYSFQTVLFEPWHKLESKIEFIPQIFHAINKQAIKNSDLVVIIGSSEKPSKQRESLIQKCDQYKKPYILLSS